MKISQFVTGGTLFLFALTAGAVQGRGQGQDNHGQDQHDQDRHDQDHHDRNRDGQHGQEHMKFDDHDRQVSRDWYNSHRDHPPMGLRSRDRLPERYESRLHEGYVLDPYMRSRIYAVPGDYNRNLPPAPRGYRYVFVGGHTVLIDGDYRVHDVIHFELNF